MSGHTSTRPGAASGSDSCTGLTSSADSPRSACGRANTVSTASSTFGPERNECWKLHVPQFVIDAARQALVKASPHGVELARRRALERKDRLLLVADREDRAPHLPRAGAGEKFGRQMADDLPLLRAGILRLVDQHVIDAVVELVVHPGGAILGQQRERLVDQVVVVEQAAPVLLGLVARDHRVRDGQQRRGAIAARDGVAPLEQRDRRDLARR